MLNRFAVVLLAASLMAMPAIAQSVGESLFVKNCANCHAADGSGQGNSRMHVVDLRSPKVQSLSDAELYDSIARGTRHREYPHGYELRGMSKSQIQALVAHIRTLKK